MYTTEKKQEAISKFSDESPCVCFNIRKAARIITQIYDDMFKEIGLTSTQAAVLNSIRIIGPMTVLQLADAMATDRTTLTRNLKPLEREGLIRIQPGYDRRQREIMITQKGIDASSQAFVVYQKFRERVDKIIGKERMDAMCKDLGNIIREIKKIR